jgi:hypothetical protein
MVKIAALVDVILARGGCWWRLTTGWGMPQDI